MIRRMLRNRMWWLAAVLLVLPAGSGAQEAYSGAGSRAGVQFLKLGHGPAGAALAGGLTAWRATADAVHANPAAVVGESGSQSWQMLSLAGTRLYGDDRLTSLIWARGSDRGGIAVEVAYNGISGIEVRDAPTTEPLALTSAHDVGVGIGGGLRLPGDLTVGLILRGLYEKLYEYDAFGIGCDAGLQLPVPGTDGLLRAGVAVKNVGRMGRLDTERLTLPWSVAGGVALNRPLRLGAVEIMAGADLWKPADDWAQVRVGVQARSAPLIFRLGTRQGRNWNVLTAGLGLSFGNWVIEYAYEYDPDVNRHFLGSVQHLGLAVDLQAIGAGDGRRNRSGMRRP